MQDDQFFAHVSRRPPFTKLHPKVGGFFKEYLAKEKVTRFGDRFVIHKENSPREPLEIFAELVARDPSVLTRRVAFDFPRDLARIEREIGRRLAECGGLGPNERPVSG